LSRKALSHTLIKPLRVGILGVLTPKIIPQHYGENLGIFLKTSNEVMECFFPLCMYPTPIFNVK
jgi:hypothetical protein